MRRRKIPTRQVVLLDRPGRAPESKVELLATAILQSRGALPLQRLVDQVADELFRQEFGFAWALDIGVLGSTVFAADVAKAIETGEGSLWKITEAELRDRANILKEHKHG
jgi:hypothetical protein